MYSGDAMDTDRDIIIEADLDVGDYAIYCEVEWA